MRDFPEDRLNKPKVCLIIGAVGARINRVKNKKLRVCDKNKQLVVVKLAHERVRQLLQTSSLCPVVQDSGCPSTRLSGGSWILPSRLQNSLVVK